MSPQAQRYLLVVEDSDDDFEAFTRSCKSVGFSVPVERCVTADDALTFLKHTVRALPALILMDLNLPGMDGREFLVEIKKAPPLRTVPVVIYTTSSNPLDVDFCYENHANSYQLKPTGANELRNSTLYFAKYWFEIAHLPTS